jgi:hypothetical protein
MRPDPRDISAIRSAFDRGALRRICEMPEEKFGPKFGMKTVPVDQKGPDDFYFFKDNGSNVLAVAHLDTVIDSRDRRCRFVNTEGAGTVVFSGALDDRLGAYVILELLPRLGLTYDWLLTVGEESGASTARFFDPGDKQYDWIIEFDRGDTDVVMYQFEDDDAAEKVEDTGATVGEGSFSDIAYLEHLGVKAFNWGVAYEPNHGPRAHAFLEDTFMMVGYYLDFHRMNRGTTMPHIPDESGLIRRSRHRSSYSPWGHWDGEVASWRLAQWDDETDASSFLLAEEGE